ASAAKAHTCDYDTATGERNNDERSHACADDAATEHPAATYSRSGKRAGRTEREPVTGFCAFERSQREKQATERKADAHTDSCAPVARLLPLRVRYSERTRSGARAISVRLQTPLDL